MNHVANLAIGVLCMEDAVKDHERPLCNCIKNQIYST